MYLAALAPALVVTPYEFRRDLLHKKTEVPEESYGIDPTFSYFGTMVACYGQTDRYRHTAHTALA